MNKEYHWPFPHSPFPLWWKWSSSFTLAAVGAISKLWLHCLSSTKVYNHETLLKAICNRSKTIPLVTGDLVFVNCKFSKWLPHLYAKSSCRKNLCCLLLLKLLD